WKTVDDQKNELSVQGDVIRSLLFNEYLETTLIFYYRYMKIKAARKQRNDLDIHDSETRTKYINFAIRAPTTFV
ncbi:hypothetical protein MKX01_023575, partial [Papaver californicum]